MSVSFREINRLAIPAIISGIAEPVIALADTAIIGQLGTAQLGGVGIASSFFLLIVWVLAQTKSAVSAIVSRYYGMRRVDEINSLIPQAVLLNITIGLLFTLVTGLFSTEIFQLYNAEGALLQFADEYFSIRSIGFAFTLATFSLFGVFRGLQNTSWAMQISIVGGILNILFDFLLVFGIEGLVPAMGVKGAAWASLIAQVAMFILTVIYLLKNTNLHLKFNLPLHPEIFNLARMSLHLFVRTLALNVAYYLGNRFATGYGNQYIAAHTIAMNIWLFSSFFIDGYANAGNALAGRLAGEKNHAALYKMGIDLSKVNLAVSVVLAMAYFALYPVIGSFFSQESEVVAVFNTIFWLVILSQPVNSVAFTFDGIFKGLGETVLLRNVLLISTFLIFVPMIYLLDYFGLGIKGIWITFILWMVFRAWPLVFKFKKDHSPLN